MVQKEYLKEAFWNEFFQSEVGRLKRLYGKNAFTYELPKEEQLRADLYGYLTKKNYFVEIESDLIKRSTDKVKSEFDLRILSDSADFFIEIKRTWAMHDWVNKYGEFLESWKDDVNKLLLVGTDSYTLRNTQRYCYFFLIAFYNNPTFRSRLRIDELHDNILNNVQSKRFESLGNKLNNNISCDFFVWVFKP
jgi:3-methyladenine DNA glycosylase AlkD